MEPSIFQGFQVALEFGNFLVLFIGVTLGILIGALPGLTATMGVALLLPFTIGAQMSAAASMSMLIGIYIGAIFGGSIPAVLIRTPGTPASAATLMDGFPMCQAGNAGEALGLVTFGSFCGGMISCAIMIFLSPVISHFAERFSYAEYFALAVFGLSMIASISGGNVLKGMISGIFGLLLATVGFDPVSGVPRYTFGMPGLLDGVSFIPALIGLFAFSQVFMDISILTQGKFEQPALKNMIPRIGGMLKHWFLIVRTALMGTFVGSLPGAGCDIAAFIGLNEAKRSSRHPEKFGTGIPEGILGPEACKSGATGGAMIPMLTLGIPGDAVTAIMLGALTIQGLQPGPLLFKDHLDVVYPFFASMILANIVMIFVGFVSAKYIAKIVSIDKKILLPVICVLSVIGAYAMRQSLFDVAVAIVMGVVGFAMRKWDYPAAPIVLALILGPMAESNLRRALLLPDASVMMFFTRPITAVLLLFAIGTVIFGLRSSMKSGTAVSDAR
ncbi:MAG: C4-dicarboxylate ABC transporter permease [Candidatus Omnitrophota bacterium]|jgi:putative tricarboxylic transport membrane protein|nr:MAG: C4-dicarboxylate ABC transporter permease [Candidatus Omnitrophota bacterium]